MISPLQQLAQLALGHDAGAWAAAQHTEGRTWTDIAADLSDRIGSPVSRETVRLWAKDAAKVVASPTGATTGGGEARR